MNTERTWIRGGYVLSMDEELGDLPIGDVLVEGDRIAAVSHHLEVDDARVIDAQGHIVMPGFADTHRHTWQTQMRGICADWTLNDYFLGIRLAISPAYSPEDVYVGNYVGALEALNAGVTTIVDFSHCNNSSDDDWHLLARAGAKVSISPETELNMGMGRLALGKCRAFGIRPTLSCDIVSLNSGDLFSQMRLALAYQRFADNDPINQRGAMPQTLTCSARDALRWATCNGADACGLELQIGSLRPGKSADIIVVGGDSFAGHPRHDAAGSVVFQATSQDARYVLLAGR